MRRRDVDTSLGRVVLVGDDEGLRALLYPGGPTAGSADAVPRQDHGFEDVVEQLGEYLAGERREFDLRLAPRGTPFQLRAWEALRAIPYGDTRSYGEQAAMLGDRGLARAVGLANNRNPISVVVPCHRVIGADGSLVGYGGGLDMKRALLDLESKERPLF